MAIGVGDMIGPGHQVCHDSYTHQIHLLIKVVGSKNFIDHGNRVARRSKRGYQRKIYPLEPEITCVFKLFMGGDKLYFHVFTFRESSL